MVDLKQEGRPIGVETPFGKDVLVLTEFSGEENLSSLFSFDLEMLSTTAGIDPQTFIGEPVSFYVLNTDGSKRWFNGVVSVFSYVGEGDRVHTYRARVVPWFWLLTHGSDCRVFEADEARTAKEIIDEILGDLGFTDYRWDVKRTFRKREYCTQYRETHLDFISRLLEEEGVGYYFQHEQGKHTLVFFDHVDGAYDVKESEVSHTTTKIQRGGTVEITAWNREYEFHTGKSTTTDYDFENPTSLLKADSSTLVGFDANSKLDRYDFPGDYKKAGEGKALAKLRMEAEESGYAIVNGASVCRTFSPGGRFKIKDHPVDSEKGKKFLIRTVHHQASQGGSYLTGGSPSDIYSNSFSCQPAETVYRPPRAHAKPRVMGPHSAVVTGPSGEEIYTDKYGRVKVQFHWDRLGKKDEKSSFWVRVITPWAGSGWGMIQIPRIGQEVIIDFLEGDPDRPIISGMVYNANNMPPYPLPAEMTKSGVRTQSTKSGGSDNFNEIYFEDKKDSELFYMHAEKDFECEIENNEKRKVGFEDKDKGDQEIEIYNDQKVKIGQGSKGGSQQVDIHKDRKVKIATGNDSLQVDTGNRDVKIKKGNQSHQVDMGNVNVKIKMGNQVTKLDLGKASTNAMQAIELVCGPSSIKLTPAGVEIKGLMVTVKGDVKTSVEGTMTEVKGAAMLKAQGGITMIN